MEQTTQHRRSVVGPLLLIGAGVIFLLSNLGYLTGNIWDLLFRYWPILLIIGGLDSIYKREGLFGPVFLVSLGTIILMINLGYLSWDVWGLVFRFWPALIILAGVSIILHRYLVTWWGALLTLLIVLGVVAGIFWYAGRQPLLGQPLPSSAVSQPLGAATQASLTISPSVGNIHIHKLSGADALISGTVSSVANEQIEQQNLSQGDTAIYTIHSRGIWRTFSFGQNSPISWDLGITPTVPVDITYEIGAGQTTLDLTGLNISHLKVDSAVGSTTITLPETGVFDGEVNGAIGQMTIYVPAKLAVQIHANGGLNSVDVPSNFTRSGNEVFTSPTTTAGGTQTAILKISQAIGNLVIRMLP
jgi:hypothetical protein